jgi:hypothetical protein
MATAKTPNGKKVGRKSDLTQTMHDRIVEFISGGNYVETAVAAAGISKTTYYNWIDRGQSERDRLKANPDIAPDEDEAPFLAFLDAIEKAQAEAEARNVAIIQKAAFSTWQAAAWWLERTRSKKYARMEKTELTGSDGGAVRLDVSTEALESKVSKILDKRSSE